MAMFIKPWKSLLGHAGRAIRDYHMIREGDRILIGISGGKDSLSLLHILQHFRQVAPVHFEIGAVTVDPVAGDFDPSPLIPYMEALGVDYHYRRVPIMELAQQHMGKPSYCAFCSRLRRGIIYRSARDHGYNVIALAQHLDDLAESFLMSALHGGQLRTMKAHYVNDDGDLRVIRPLVYLRERHMRDFAARNSLPVIPDSCPACFAKPTQRQHFKELLAREERENITLFKSLLSTLKPLMAAGLPAYDAEDNNNRRRIRGQTTIS